MTHTALALSIIETESGGLAIRIATKEGERITVETSDLLLHAFVEQASKALQDHARKRARH